MIYKKFGLGKLIGGRVYLHKKYINKLPSEIIDKIKRVKVPFNYTIIKYDIKTQDVFLLECNDFDTNPEPIVGRSFNCQNNKITNPPSDPWIYHHKWMFVDKNYKGFDYDESYNRSLEWQKLNLDKSRIGKLSYWKKYALPYLEKNMKVSIPASVAKMAMYGKTINEEFLEAYLECAIWASINPDTDEPFDADFEIKDFSTKAKNQAKRDCLAFLEKVKPYKELLMMHIQDAGHAFWLDRNGHGTGFWDNKKIWGEKASKKLSDAAKTFKEINVECGDDKKLYFI